VAEEGAFNAQPVRLRETRFRKLFGLVLCVVMVLSAFCSLSFVLRGWSAALLAVNPASITVSGTGEVFSVDVTVTGVIDLYACGFKLYYDPTFLNGVSIIEGPFLRSQRTTFFLSSFDATNGFARVADSVLGDVSGVSGSGVIATITFQTIQLGSSSLVLGETQLSNSVNTPIVHTTSDGVVQIIPIVHDVAVTKAVVSSVEAVPSQVVNVSAVVVNQGGGTLTFNVAAYANAILVGTSTVSHLAGGSSTTVTIPWDTKGFALGAYRIRAEAEAQPDETDLADNVFTDGTVTLVPAPVGSLSLQPQMSRVSGLDVEFGVDLMVTGVTNLYGWQVTLYYSSVLLNGNFVTEGSFLKTVGSTFFFGSPNDNYNATHGSITLGCSLLGNISGVSGSGQLATIYFKTKALGVCLLTLSATKLGDPDGLPMEHTLAYGVVEIAPPVRDVAVENVVLSRNEVGEGHSVNVSVVVSNKGSRNEDFTVNLYANDTIFGYQDVLSLAAGSQKTLIYVWDTVNLTLGSSYQVRAEATLIPDETNTGNNVFVDGLLTITQGSHDVAINSVIPQQTILYEGKKMNITVSASNRGDFSETFGVTLYYDNSTIDTKTVTNLPHGQDQTLTYTWDTTGVASNKSYVLKAVAGVVPGETNVVDNALADGSVTIVPVPTVYVNITNVAPSDQSGQAQSSFVRGTMAYFKTTVSCNSIFPELLLLTVNVYDANNLTLTVISFRGFIAPGSTSFVLGSIIPATAAIGNAAVYVNALTDWPHLGGTPYCPEKSASFQIRGL
jgi:hypothetical protein